MSATATSRRVRSKRWTIVYPSVYFIGPGQIPWKSRLAAACAWAGTDAVVSHLAAAQLHGLLTSRNAVSVTVGRKKNSANGVEVHWHPDGVGQTVKVDGIPVTSVERTILDICRSSRRRFALEITERAIRGGRTNLRRLVKLLDDPATKPCRTLAWILKKRFAHGVTDSEAEDLYMRLARKDPSCRGWVHHHVVTRHGQHLAELDFAYLAELVNVEIDGDEAHDNPVAGQRDKRRDALLGEMGWIVLRFTYWQLVDEPEWVIDRVRATLSQRRARLLHG
jgi:hypothetical protein